MRILFINDEYTVGGATKALCELLIALKEKGHEPIVCTSRRDWFNDFLDRNGIQNIVDRHKAVMDVISKEERNHAFWFQKRQLKYLLSRYRAARIIAQRIDMSTIDIIHTNSARNDVGCILQRRYHIPHVMHVREYGIEDFSCSVMMPFYCKYLNRRCNVVLTVSDSVGAAWKKRGLSAGICKTLYDGVDFTSFVVKKENRIDDEQLKIVMVGGICATKGQHIAVKAMAKLPREVREHVVLDFAGWNDPVYYDKLMRLVKRAGLEEQVRFLGSRDDVNELLSKYNVGLMCSKSEGFGRVTAEYMYAGLGVIAADTGASPELVTDCETGLIYHRENYSELADRILDYYYNPQLLADHGKAAHRIAQERFSLKSNLEKTLKVYERLLRKEG